jgi:hypothetical protein
MAEQFQNKVGEPMAKQPQNWQQLIIIWPTQPTISKAHQRKRKTTKRDIISRVVN